MGVLALFEGCQPIWAVLLLILKCSTLWEVDWYEIAAEYQVGQTQIKTAKFKANRCTCLKLRPNLVLEVFVTLLVEIFVTFLVLVEIFASHCCCWWKYLSRETQQASCCWTLGQATVAKGAFSGHAQRAFLANLVSASVFWILKLISCCSNCRFRFSHSSFAFWRSLPASTCKATINDPQTHRSSFGGWEFRSCFTSIRKAAISSKCLACGFG